MSFRKWLLAAVVALVSGGASAQTATTPISGLPLASTTADGTEYLVGVQAGVTRKFKLSTIGPMLGPISLVVPFPSSTTLGGAKSSTCAASAFVTGLGTDGVFTCSGLPAPTVSALGGIKSTSSVAHQWLSYCDTTGTCHQTQPDAADVSFTQSGTGAVATDLSSRAKNRVDVTDFGAVADGTTDDSAAIQTATTYATSVGKVVYFPGAASPYLACHISTVSGMGWVGDGPSRSIIKMKNSCNTSLIDNGTSHTIDNVLFYNLGFDGNRANNTDGDIIVTYGAKPTIVNVDIYNVAGNALQTNWDTSYASRTTGFEGFFQNIHIDTVNKSGWINAGPNDSYGDSIYVTDTSLATDNGYYGIYMSGYGNGRWNNIHYSNRDATSTIPIAGVYIASTGNTFTNTHFEGGYAPLIVTSSANVFSGEFYAPRGAYAVQMNAGYNTLTGALCVAAASSNPNYAGINLASAGNIINVTSSNCNNGVVNFASDGGNNIVTVRGYQASGTAVANYASRAATTIVDMEVTGGATSGSHHDFGGFLPADGAWTAYTPTLTYPGTAPTTAAVSGRWKQIGTKTYLVHVNYNVSTLGPGTGNVYFSIPNSATLAHNAVCSAINYSAGTVQASIAATAVGAIILTPAPALAAQQYYLNCTVETN